MPRSSRVKLLKQVKINDKWVLATARFDSKGRVRKDHVRVSGTDENHPEGSYFIEWWDQGQRHREAAGPMAWPLPRRYGRSKPIGGRGNGIIPAPPVEAEPGAHCLSCVLDAISSMSAIIGHCEPFAPTVPSSTPSALSAKIYVDDVERQDLLDFATDCLKQGQKGKSIYNKLVVISQVMKQHGKAQAAQCCRLA